MRKSPLRLFATVPVSRAAKQRRPTATTRRAFGTTIVDTQRDVGDVSLANKGQSELVAEPDDYFDIHRSEAWRMAGGERIEN